MIPPATVTQRVPRRFWTANALPRFGRTVPKKRTTRPVCTRVALT